MSLNPVVSGHGTSSSSSAPAESMMINSIVSDDITPRSETTPKQSHNSVPEWCVTDVTECVTDASDGNEHSFNSFYSAAEEPPDVPYGAAEINDGTRRENSNGPVALQVIRDLDPISLGLTPQTREPITTAELQANGMSRAEADRMAARRNAQVNLQRRLTHFFRLWTFILVFFGTSTIVSLFILMLNYDKHPPGSTELRWWSEVVFASHLYSIFLHRFMLRKVCKYRQEEHNHEWPESMPKRVKIFKITRTVFGIAWSILGLCLASLPADVEEIKSDVDFDAYDQFARAALFYSIFNLCLYFHLIVVISLPHWVLQYAYNLGYTPSGNPDAAPKGTAEKLETVDVTKPLGQHFLEIAHDGCSICMEEFNPKKVVVKKTECDHYFHFKCIDNWLQVSRHCPLCRKDLVHESGLDSQGEKAIVIGVGGNTFNDAPAVENV